MHNLHLRHADRVASRTAVLHCFRDAAVADLTDIIRTDIPDAAAVLVADLRELRDQPRSLVLVEVELRDGTTVPADEYYDEHATATHGNAVEGYVEFLALHIDDFLAAPGEDPTWRVPLR